MPYKNESMLMGGDASADTSTELCFNPPEGPFDASNVVKGNIMHVGDEDWIAIKLTEGNTYTISTGGDTETAGALNDSVLKLMDGKGGMIAENDDVKAAEGMLGSSIEFTPEAGSGTQVYFISVSGYTGNPGAMNTGTYTVTVKEVAHPPAGEGVDIEGTSMADKLTGTENSESIAGLAGDDTIYGLGGDDTLDGGMGNDLLVGGAGEDTLKGGMGTDTISYMGSPMGVTINLRAGTASGGDAEGDTLGEMIENVMGSMYDDTLTGTRGDNSIWGLGGNDSLSGDRGTDMLYGGAGDDSLDGDDGNDTLEGGYGADELTGGDGADTASYASSMMGVTVRLHASQAMGGDAEGDTWGDTTTVEYELPNEDGEMESFEETVPDIINLKGSAMADILAGDSRGNTIEGGGGDDKIYGGPGGGNDTLHGDGGADMLFGGRGTDTLSGGAGDDMLNGGAGADTIYGGAGSDMIYADSDDAVINGWLAAYDDTDPADGEPDSPYMGPIDDTDTADVNESLEATNDPMAVDTVSYAKLKSGVTVTLGAGGITNIENLIGTDENDAGLTGDNRDNVINGLDGADVLNGGDAADAEVNGDTVSYKYSDRGVTVNLLTNVVSGGHAQGDTISNFENATGSAHDDNLTGSAGANTLSGLDGDDELEGGAEGDTIEGGAGADEMDGGTDSSAGTLAVGNTAGGVDAVADTLSYKSSDAGVQANLTTLMFSGGHAEGDEVEVQRDALDPDGVGDMDPVDVATFENLTGSDHDDRLTGDHRVNMLTGGKGDDTLRGMAGVDTLNGGPGADYLDGGEDAREDDSNMITARAAMDLNGDGDTDDAGEAEIVAAAASVDVATYAGAMAGITVNLASGRGTAGDAMGDTLVNIEQVVGSSNDDTFIAGPGPDNVIGGDHDGDDPMGATDTEDGDTISYELSPEAVIVDLTVATAQPQGTQDEDSHAIGDILASIENVMGSDQDDTITGDTNANRLMGGAGNDMLNGGDETAPVGDTLMGGAGRDTLNGGGGADRLMGGDGNDTLNGGADADTLNGGAGDDDLTGDGGSDTFVFGLDNGDDVITEVAGITDAASFVTSQGRIDLRAFDIDPADLAGLISTRAGNTVINLSDYGGGTITIQDIDDLDVFEAAGGTDNGEIDTISYWMDDNGDTTDDPTDGDGMVDAGEPGIFIL